MDFSDFEALHADGHDTTAWIRFAQMCRQALYDGYGLPADVSHLVHYTTLETLTSMLGVVEAAHEKYRLATPVAKEVAEERGGSVGYLRLYDTFSSNDPNEGAFFVNSANAKGSFRRRYNAVWSLFEDRSASPAYQTSLTYVGDTVEADNLVFWRTYGKEGTGCALAFPMTCFDGQANLFRIRYGEGEVATCLDTLSELLEEYGKIPGAPDFSSMSRISELPKPLVSVLSPLVYLYKSEAYEYEKEVRISVVAWIGAEMEFALSQAVASGDAFEHRPSECGHCVQNFLADLDFRDLPGEAAGFELGADDTLPTADLRFYPAALVVPCGRLPGHAAVAADLGNMAIPNGWIPRRLRSGHCVLRRRYNHVQGLPIPFPQQIPCSRSIIGTVRQKARDRGIELIQEPG